jgi:hypothetical protein
MSNTNSINEDIQSTLDKLAILLQYSTSPKSDGVYQLILRAKAAWESQDEVEVHYER